MFHSSQNQFEKYTCIYKQIELIVRAYVYACAIVEIEIKYSSIDKQQCEHMYCLLNSHPIKKMAEEKNKSEYLAK